MARVLIRGGIVVARSRSHRPGLGPDSNPVVELGAVKRSGAGAQDRLHVTDDGVNGARPPFAG